MENVLKFIIGLLLIVLSFAWYSYGRKKIVNERKKEDYMSMSFTIKFIFGALTLLFIGIKLIYDAF